MTCTGKKSFAVLLLSVALSSTVSALAHDTYKIGTRSSDLAIAMTKTVQRALSEVAGISSTVVSINASGDIKKKDAITTTQDVPLAKKSVDFTGALDDALSAGHIDMAVHSLKDVSPLNRWREDLEIACHLGPRADVNDVLVGPYSSIAELPMNARVGSASIRRQAQLLAQRPDIVVVNVRGNIPARVAALKNGDVDALILAAAGLERLHNDDPKRGVIPKSQIHRIPCEEILPGAAQGIIAVACRADDNTVESILRKIDDREAHISAAAERALLDVCDGQLRHRWPGRPPVAAFMSHDDIKGTWSLRGLLATPDGTNVVRTVVQTEADCDYERALELGKCAGQKLIEEGGPDFLDKYY